MNIAVHLQMKDEVNFIKDSLSKLTDTKTSS